MSKRNTRGGKARRRAEREERRRHSAEVEAYASGGYVVEGDDPDFLAFFRDALGAVIEKPDRR